MLFWLLALLATADPAPVSPSPEVVRGEDLAAWRALPKPAAPSLTPRR